MTVTSEVLQLTRLIRAPRQRVWDAWTQVEHIRNWSAPEGLIVADMQLDLRVGGVIAW